MSNDLINACSLLEQGDYTCVVCHNDITYTATERGVKPLLHWLDTGRDLTGYSAADRVVGRATAYLYVLLGVKEVFARIMSHPARQVLQSHNIDSYAERLVDGIINRKGDGPCPFETAVMEITDATDALTAIRNKMLQMQGGPTT